MRTKQEKRKKTGGEGKREKDGRFTKCTAFPPSLLPSLLTRLQCLSCYTTCFVRCNDDGGGAATMEMDQSQSQRQEREENERERERDRRGMPELDETVKRSHRSFSLDRQMNEYSPRRIRRTGAIRCRCSSSVDSSPSVYARPPILHPGFSSCRIAGVVIWPIHLNIGVREREKGRRRRLFSRRRRSRNMRENRATCVAHILQIETRPLDLCVGIGAQTGREKYETNETFAMKIRIILSGGGGGTSSCIFK